MRDLIDERNAREKIKSSIIKRANVHYMTPEELADTVQEARELSETFSTIADIMEQKLLPADWRNAASGEEPDNSDSERPEDGGDS